MQIEVTNRSGNVKVVEEYTLDKPIKYKVGDVIDVFIGVMKDRDTFNEVLVVFKIIEVTDNKCVVEAETEVDDIGLLNFATFNFNPYEGMNVISQKTR